MAFTIRDNGSNARLSRNLEQARRENADAMEKLSTGQVFTTLDPRPAERAISDNLEFRLRSLASSKRNINDAISLLQTAESSMSEINNIITRMKEINVASASTTVGDQDRRFLFLEYQALHDEVNRIATTTQFNGIPLLNGRDENAPESLVFRVDDPFFSSDRWAGEDDLNAIRLDGLKSIVATTDALGIKSARELLLSSSEDGIQLEDVEELLIPQDPDLFSTAYDQALNILTTQRSVYGAMQSRLQRSMDFVDVYQENIAAAKSKISDTDYASEISRLTESKILMSAATAVLAQGNINSQLSLSLLSSVLK